ncbi:MAG: small multi-drug export protein [Eubacteriales bacterium]|nr:small multi-drug export protein [Eubacteriales bacterium]
MADTIIQFLENTLHSNYELILLIGSAIPITEMRATIPLGILAWGMDPWLVMVLGFLGSLLPVPFILLFFEGFFKGMKKIAKLAKLNSFIENKIQDKAQHFKKSTELALIIFVAIPLPGTGLWTGSMVATVLGFRFWPSFLSVAAGGVLSAIILTILSVFFSAILGM